MSSVNPNDLLSAYYDREAGPNEEPAAKSLVEGSSEASRELKDYQRLSQLIQELPRLAAPPEFPAAVMQRAERESLIPLDPVVSEPSAASSARSHSRRQRWILAGAATVSVAAALLIAATVFGPFKSRAPREEIAIARDDRSAALSSDLERRRVATRPAVVLTRNDRRAHSEPASPAAASGPTAKSMDASKREMSYDAKADALPRAPAPASSMMRGKNAPAETEASAKSRELDLMLPANLKTAKVGDVVEALQQDGQQVAVVRLTVVNQVEGLDGVQSLLVRNTSRTLQNVDEIKQLRLQFAANKAAPVPKAAIPSAAGDMICVYVEGSRDEMLGVLQDLQNESHIQAAELTNTISFTTLEEYTSPAVAGQLQNHDRSAVRNQVMKGAAVQAPSAAGSQRAVSLPASTVDKILTAGQSAANTRGQNSKPSALGPALQQHPADKATADQLDFAKPQENNQGQATVASRRPAPNQSNSRTLAKQGRSQTRDANEVAATQKSFQIFFVITDQPQGQTAQPAQNAAKSPAIPANRSEAGQSAPAAKVPASSSAPNRAP
jgi:hypothetical protein